MTRSALYAAGLGVLFGILGVPMLQEEAEHAYDALMPVAVITATEIERTPERLSFSMVVDKRRDCELLRLVAHDTTADGTTRLTIDREGSANSTVLPPGLHKPAHRWIVAPVPKGKLSLYAHHQCGDRVVRTQIAVR